MDNSRQSEKHDSESSSLLGKDNSFVKNQLERSLRLQRVCNRTLVHAKNEQELLQGLCQSIISEGGYRFAWIGYVQNDEKQSVNPVAHAGHGADYLNALQVSWGENEAGQGPTGRAIRSGQPCIVQDIPTEPNYTSWREAAQQQGYRASMALPLTDESRVFGVLNIYAGEPDAFQDEEVQSLIFFAIDLSYGIRALRTDRERKQVEEALRQSEGRYQNLANNIPGMIFQTRTTLEGDFSVLYASSGCYDLYEVSPEEMMTGSPYFS